MTINKLPISCWAAEDIPTVKAANNSYNTLSNAELLSIIIGSGSMLENAIELARKLLYQNGNSLKKLSNLRVSDITQLHGIGKIKASKVLASLELAKRMNMENADKKLDFSTPTAIYTYMHPRIAQLDIEEFWVLYLNQHYKLIESKRHTIGGITETAADIRILMRDAVLCNATVMAVCHNHPSGSTTPSKQDDQLTYAIKKACETMRIHFLDHMIVTDGMYYSYNEHGKI